MEEKKMRILILLGIILSMFAIFAAAQTQPAFGTLQVTLLNQDPDPAEPGKYVELRFRVTKQGSDPLTDVAFTLEPVHPLYFDDSDTAVKTLGFVGGLVEEEYYTLYYKLRVADEAIKGAYEITLMARTGSGAELEYKFDIRVDDPTRPEFVIGSIVTNPAKLWADTDEAELSVQLENVGDMDAENVFAIMELPTGFSPTYSYSDRVTVGTVGAGTGQPAKFYVDINESVAGGEYPADMIVRYKEPDENSYKTVRVPFTLQVKNRPQFEIVSSSPLSAKPGDDIELRIQIRNIGGDEAESVSLRAFKDASQPFDFEDKSDFIGKLAPGETGDAVLKVTVDKDAAQKNYVLDIEVRSVYKGEVLVQEKSINLEVADSAGMPATGMATAGAGSPFILMLVSAIIAASALGFLLGRRR
jgi:hypothetical protein